MAMDPHRSVAGTAEAVKTRPSSKAVWGWHTNLKTNDKSGLDPNGVVNPTGAQLSKQELPSAVYAGLPFFNFS